MLVFRLPCSTNKVIIHQAEFVRSALKNIYSTKKIQKAFKLLDFVYNMAKKFFPDEWETITQDELVRSRARLSGFIEAILDTKDDKDKLIKDVSIRKPIQGM